jgi:hypothetical protein
LAFSVLNALFLFALGTGNVGEVVLFFLQFEVILDLNEFVLLCEELRIDVDVVELSVLEDEFKLLPEYKELHDDLIP